MVSPHLQTEGQKAGAWSGEGPKLSGGQSGMLVPKGEEGRTQAKWFISWGGGLFPEHPATPACLPCPGGAFLQPGVACRGDVVSVGPAGCRP